MANYTNSEADDDPEFVAWVESVIRRVEGRYETERTYVVKIDNWFGRRWLGFSGKSMGTIGVRKRKLTLPPFVPSRVLWQRRFRAEGAQPKHQRRLHVRQQSGENLQRYAEVLIHDASVFWYSGGTARNDRGSFMAYVHAPDGHWPWYLGLRRTDSWRIVEAQGISASELKELTETGGLTSA